MNNGLTAENLLLALPEALRQDEQMQALAAGIAEVLAARPAEIDRLLIYPRIDELPEALLDRLAYDFKVDWWDAEYSLAAKRQTLKDNWQVHRRLGTKAAVEQAIAAIYPETQVLEWFEYGGEPYHFKLEINLTFGWDTPDKRQRVLDRVEYYKNLRSHLDTIDYYLENSPQKFNIYGGSAFFGNMTCTELPQLVWEQPMQQNINVAAQAENIMLTDLPQLAWRQGFAENIFAAAERGSISETELSEIKGEVR